MKPNVFNGIVGGVTAGLVFGMMMQMMMAPTPEGGQMPMMAMVAKVVRSESMAVGWLYHLFSSAVIGLEGVTYARSQELILGLLGHREQALLHFDRALDIEPLLLPARTWRALVLHLSRRHEDAVRQYRQALEIEPNLFRALVEGTFPIIALRRWSEGLDTLERAESVYGEHPRILGLRGHILAATGQKTAALEVLNRLHDIEKNGFASGFEYALVWIGLDDLDRAVAELERCYEQQYCWILFAECLPIFDPLHGCSRYEALMRRLH